MVRNGKKVGQNELTRFYPKKNTDKKAKLNKSLQKNGKQHKRPACHMAHALRESTADKKTPAKSKWELRIHYFSVLGKAGPILSNTRRVCARSDREFTTSAVDEMKKCSPRIFRRLMRIVRI